MSKYLGLFVDFGKKAVTAHKLLRKLGGKQSKPAPRAGLELQAAVPFYN
jgi:hypothetical protein